MCRVLVRVYLLSLFCFFLSFWVSLPFLGYCNNPLYRIIVSPVLTGYGPFTLIPLRVLRVIKSVGDDRLLKS